MTILQTLIPVTYRRAISWREGEGERGSLPRKTKRTWTGTRTSGRGAWSLEYCMLGHWPYSVPPPSPFIPPSPSLYLRSPTHESPMHVSYSSGRRRRRDARRRKNSQSSESKKARSSRGSFSPSPTPTSPPVTPSPLPTSPLTHSPEDDDPSMESDTNPRVGYNRNSSSNEAHFKPVSETSLSTPKIPTEPSLSGLSGGPRGSADTGPSSSSLCTSEKHRKLSRKRLTESYGDSPGGSQGLGGGEEGRGGLRDGVPTRKLTNGVSSPHISPGQPKKAGRGRGNPWSPPTSNHPDPVRPAWSKTPSHERSVQFNNDWSNIGTG